MSAQIERERQAAIEMVAAAQRRLDDALQRAVASSEHLDVTRPSVLPGWTVGHVLTHIARNADSHLQMLDGEAQYGGSVDERNAAIEVGALRSVDDIIADVAMTSARLIERWEQLGLAGDWDGNAFSIDGSTHPRSALPMLRLREVLIHHIDLGLRNVGYADLPSEFVRRELRRLMMVYNARHSMGMGGLPGPVLELAPYDRLAWLLGRRSVDGVPDPTT